MAAIPPYSDLQQQDAPTSIREWAGRFFRTLNEFARGVVAGFSNGLTVGDNMLAQVVTATVTASSNNSPQNPLIVFRYNLKGSPKGLVIWQVTDITTRGTHVPLPKVGLPDWENLAAGTQPNAIGTPITQIRINSLNGLTPGSKYSITFAVHGG